jgi:vitamin B12 transporter
VKKHLLAGLFLLPVTALAQDEGVVITITGYGISAEKALVPVEVLERADILDANASDMGELLGRSNGLETARNGGPGQATSLFFRGTESDHHLVLINGVAINSAAVASASLGTLDTQLLQRVEVVKGPQSTLWGSGAIGGVINASTLPAAGQGDSAFVAAGYGAHNSFRSSAIFSHGGPASQVSVGLSRHTTDGIPTLRISDDTSAYENTSFNLAVATETHGYRLQAAHWQTQGESEYQAFTYPPPDYSLALAGVSQDFLTSASSLSVQGQPFAAVDSSLQLSLARDHIDQNDSPDFTHTDRTTLSLRNTAHLGRGDKLGFGAEVTREKASILSFGSRYRGTTDSQALYLQYDANRGAHHWLGGLRLFSHEDAGEHATWNLGYGYRLTPATRLKANLSTGYRYPTAIERFVFSPNPDLRPESSRALEVGVTHHIGQRQRLDLSLFRTEIDDLIVSTGAFPHTINININEARIQGMEAAYRLRQGPWTLEASLLLMDPRDLSNDRQLLRRSRVAGTARLGYDHERLQAGAELSYNGSRDDVDGISFTPTTTAAYTLLDLHASYDLDPGLQLFGRLDNALNTDYEVVSQYNTPGRTLFAGIRYATP